MLAPNAGPMPHGEKKQAPSGAMQAANREARDP